MNARLEQLAELAEALGLEHLELPLLNTALTHCSYAYEADVASNERLEFLGDAVIGLAIGDALYQRHPGFTEGELAKKRAVIVSARTLAEHARRLNLGQYLLLGKGEEMSGGRERASNLADSFEALVGAVYLSCGWEQVRAWVIRELNPTADDAYSAGGDYKTVLQEKLQAQGKGLPEYDLLKQEGPDHRRVFTVGVCSGQEMLGSGVGRSKKEAEQEAARVALERLGKTKAK